MAVENVVRTLMSSYVQAHISLGIPYVKPDFTTLNQKLGIAQAEVPSANDRINFNFFCIGYGGARNVTGEDGTHLQVPRQHATTDFSPYAIAPFVVRELNDDLSTADRARFCLRIVQTNPRDNKQYIFYYGRWFDKLEGPVQMTQFRIENGNQVDVSPFVPGNANINPVPSDLTNDGLNTVDGRYVRTSILSDVSWSAWDVDELMKAARIVKGNEIYAFFNELAVGAGIKRALTVSNPGGGTFTYNEAIAATATNLLNVNYQALYFRNGFDVKLNFGSTEPLFRVDRQTADGMGVSQFF